MGNLAKVPLLVNGESYDSNLVPRLFTKFISITLPLNWVSQEKVPQFLDSGTLAVLKGPGQLRSFFSDYHTIN